MKTLVKEIRIKQILKMKGMTQKQIADEVGISPMHMSFLANGRIKDPRLSLAMRIANALGEEVSDVWVLSIK